MCLYATLFFHRWMYRDTVAQMRGGVQSRVCRYAKEKVLCCAIERENLCMKGEMCKFADVSLQTRIYVSAQM